MTSGIYKLIFKGTDKVYIGQSSNIELRLMQHRALFRANKASQKMQEAYNLYGLPTLVILEVADKPLLDELEYYHINKENSVENGFNTRKSAGGGSNLWGSSNGRAIYSNEQIIDCLFLLLQTPKLTYPQIELKTDVLKATIVDVANGTGHKWLARFYPEEYALLMSYRHRRNTKDYLKAVSPEGIEYTVTHLSNFCKEHNLENGNMSRLLRGIRKSYNGWTSKA